MAHKTTKTKHPSLAREKKRSKLDLRQEKTQKKADTSMVITLVIEKSKSITGVSVRVPESCFAES